MSSSLQVDVITEMELCGLYRLHVVKSGYFSFVRDEQAHDPCPPVAHDLVGAIDTKNVPSSVGDGGFSGHGGEGLQRY